VSGSVGIGFALSVVMRVYYSPGNHWA